MPFAFDQHLFHLINTTWSSNALDPFMVFVTFIGKHKWLMALPWLLLMIKGQKKERILGIGVVVVLIATDFFVETLLKPTFARPRPFELWEQVRVLTGSTNNLSQFGFPSSHAANIFTVTTLFIVAYKKLWLRLLLLGFGFWVCISRVYMGVHTPLDVMAGALVGMATGSVGFGFIYVIALRKIETHGRIWIPGCVGIILLLAWIGFVFMAPNIFKQPIPAAPPPPTAPMDAQKNEIEDLKQEMMLLLDKQNEPQERTLKAPQKKKTQRKTKVRKYDQLSRAIDKVKKESPQRIKGIQKRKKLPLGVALFDGVKIYRDNQSTHVIYTVQTGDFMKVYLPVPESGRIHIHPGVDVYLAATSKETEIAGTALPDLDGWVERDKIQIFNPNQAIEFTQQTVPVTLGHDPDFSTVQFYERAFKNQDPVIHRIIGPRMLTLFSVHEDYLSSWGKLYRDPDSKIRSFTLASLKDRGVGNSRNLVEDLITRLSELTQTRAQDETEIEVLTIINILKSSGHARATTALASFKESWTGTQSEKILSELNR